MVAADGFPETRRVRLLLTEDFMDYLGKMGQSLPRAATARRGVSSEKSLEDAASGNPGGRDPDKTAKALAASKVGAGRRGPSEPPDSRRPLRIYSPPGAAGRLVCQHCFESLCLVFGPPAASFRGGFLASDWTVLPAPSAHARASRVPDKSSAKPG